MTLIVVFHTPSLQVSISWQIFQNVHLLSTDDKALCSCIEYLLTTADTSEEVTGAGTTVRVASLHL